MRTQDKGSKDRVKKTGQLSSEVPVWGWWKGETEAWAVFCFHKHTDQEAEQKELPKNKSSF